MHQDLLPTGAGALIALPPPPFRHCLLLEAAILADARGDAPSAAAALHQAGRSFLSFHLNHID